MAEVVTELIGAVRDHDLCEVRCLVKQGVDMNVHNTFGFTALIYATFVEYLDIATYLIDNGADVNAHDVYGYTALMFAAREGQLKLTQHLVEYGADVDVQNKYGDIALIYAAENGHTKVVKYLIEVQEHSFELYLAHPDSKVRMVVQYIVEHLICKHNCNNN